MHGIHPQVVPHSLTGITASRSRPSGQPLVCVMVRQCRTVVPFLSFELAALAVAPPQLMGFVVSWGLKWSAAAGLVTGGVVMW